MRSTPSTPSSCPCPRSRRSNSRQGRMASVPSDVFFASIPELSQRLKGLEFSAEDLTKAFSERLQQIGPRLNALVLPLQHESIREAKIVDGELKRERFRGPLQGI